jgi:hypothetical protein
MLAQGALIFGAELSAQATAAAAIESQQHHQGRQDQDSYNKYNIQGGHFCFRLGSSSLGGRGEPEKLRGHANQRQLWTWLTYSYFKHLILRVVLRHVSPEGHPLVSVAGHMPLLNFCDVFRAIRRNGHLSYISLTEAGVQ